MIKFPEALLFSLSILTPHTMGSQTLLNSSPYQYSRSTSPSPPCRPFVEKILRDVFSERFFEDGTEILPLSDQMIPIAPERGVKSVEGSGDGLGEEISRAQRPRWVFRVS